MTAGRLGVAAFIAAFCAAAALWPPLAHAHGEIESTSPAEGAEGTRLPPKVSVTLTEAPTNEASLVVTDGCRNDVTDAVDVNGATVITTVAAGAQPGRWKARYRAISSVDGHLTRGVLEFSVKGRRDCSPDEPSPQPTAERTPSEEPTLAADGDESSDDGGFPVVPLAAGGVAVVILALVVRRAGAS